MQHKLRYWVDLYTGIWWGATRWDPQIQSCSSTAQTDSTGQHGVGEARLSDKEQTLLGLTGGWKPGNTKGFRVP